MANDNKRLIAEARTPVYSMALRGRTPAEGDDLVRRLADALEAATARTDREPQPGDGPDYHAEHASWLNRNRAVVEAQALEQAADDMERSWRYGLVGSAFAWLRARAVEIREGRQ